MDDPACESWAARLQQADVEPIGRFADASNATLLVRLTDRDRRSLQELAGELGRQPELDDLDPRDLAVYKPMRGEAPLRDFPIGTLHLREVAAYEICRAMGWDLVPLTVLRTDGPFGQGSVQRFVAHDPALHYFRLLEAWTEDVVGQLRRMVLFDLVIDNADRKAGHVLLEDVDVVDAATDELDRPPPGWPSDELPGPHINLEVDKQVAGSVRLVDHGVSLNLDPKLRSVAWEFAGEPPVPEARQSLETLANELTEGPLADRLPALLSQQEIQVLIERVDRLASLDRLPGPSGSRPYPWPPI